MSLHISKERDDEFVRQAYDAVASVSTVEENDRNRLGYHVWLYLRGELETLEEAVRMARSRFTPRGTTVEDVAAIVRDALAQVGANGIRPQETTEHAV